MKISRLLLGSALVVATFAAQSVPAADAATEARLLEALRQRLAEDAPAPVATAPAAAPVIRVETAPPEIVTTTVVAPAALPSEQDDATTQRLREAVRQRAADIEAQTGTPPPAQTPAIPPAVSPTTDQLVEAMRQRLAAEPAPPAIGVDSPREARVQTVAEAVAEAEARQREAEARRLAAAERRVSRTAVPATTATAAPTISEQPAPAGLQPVPLPVPASPIPTTKEAQLAELLERYKADAITPQEYHAERARILAQ